MNEMPKISYEPSKKKRFEISNDEYSKERLETLKLFYGSMREVFDVPMGLVLFGSLAKGKELDDEKKESADIDFTLFVDLDHYQEKYIENLKKNTVFADFEERRLVQLCHNDLERKSLNAIFSDIKNGNNISFHGKEIIKREMREYSPRQFLFILATWHGYIDLPGVSNDMPTFSFRGKEEKDVEKIRHLLRLKDVQVWPIQFKGEFSIENQVRKIRDLYEKNIEDKTERSKYLLDQEQIGVARIFSLDVGGGMKLYRQAFIRDLLVLNDNDGEALWNIVNNSIRLCERNNDIPKNMERQFPQTLEEAVKYYGV